MDYNNTTSSFDSFELQFTTEAQSFLRETAKWAKFMAIIGFVFVGLYVITALVMLAGGGTMGASQDLEGIEGMEGMGAGGMIGAIGTASAIVYLLVALLYFFPMLYLYRFASKAQFALNNNNTEQLTSSMENLKSHYKFMGILMIIALVLVVLGLLLVVIGIGAAAAM